MKLITEIQKRGDLQPPYNGWSSDGQPQAATTARTDYLQNLPKALYECTCKERHHMIRPKTLSSHLAEENGAIVRKAEFDYDVHIYGHYYKESFFAAKEAFLICCKNNVVGLVDINVRGTFGGNYDRGKLEVITDISTLEAVIAHEKAQPLGKQIVHMKPLDQWT